MFIYFLPTAVRNSNVHHSFYVYSWPLTDSDHLMTTTNGFPAIKGNTPQQKPVGFSLLSPNSDGVIFQTNPSHSRTFYHRWSQTAQCLRCLVSCVCFGNSRVAHPAQHYAKWSCEYLIALPHNESTKMAVTPRLLRVACLYDVHCARFPSHTCELSGDLLGYTERQWKTKTHTHPP